MAYAILRFAKHKGGASKALSAHHERTKDSYASNPDIDLSRTAQNFHLVTPRWSYEQEIKHRIQTAGCRVRKDSVKFVDTLVTVSPEFAKAHEAEMPEYFRRAFDFLKERVGEENIISAVVHMDEKTPHMHLCFVPLTRDKRLSAKEILGNKKSMIRWQNDFYACMAERWPELERGAPAVETKRKHLTPQWYKKVTAMDAKLEKLETALNGKLKPFRDPQSHHLSIPHSNGHKISYFKGPFTFGANHIFFRSDSVHSFPTIAPLKNPHLIRCFQRDRQAAFQLATGSALKPGVFHFHGGFRVGDKGRFCLGAIVTHQDGFPLHSGFHAGY